MDFSQLQAISDICLLVQDLDRSVAFYTEKLGFTVTRRVDGFAAFNSRNISLVVWETGHLPDEPRTTPLTPRENGPRACLSVRLSAPADVDLMHETLLAREITVRRAPADYPWGARCCYFADPDEYLWEVYAEI